MRSAAENAVLLEHTTVRHTAVSEPAQARNDIEDLVRCSGNWPVCGTSIGARRST